MDGTTLTQVTTTKFLGVHIDEHFTWETHIKHCKTKTSQGVFALNMAKRIISETNLKTLYYSLVQSHLQYGIHLWGNAHQKYIKPLFITQKKCIRAVTNSRYNETSLPLFKRLGILTLHDLYNQQIASFMYKFVNELVPSPLLDVFEYHGDIHTHFTRARTDPRAPNANSDIMRRSFLYTAPTVWMPLDTKLKSSNSHKAFKSNFKRNCIDKY